MSKKTERGFIDTAADLYDLGKVTSFLQIHGGLQTPKILVQTKKGKFILSTHNLNTGDVLVRKSAESLQYEIDLLNHLKRLPVSCFRKSKKKRYIEKIGDRWVTVDTYLPGKSPKKIAPDMARQLGVFLGEFHRQGRSFKKTVIGRRRFYDLNAQIVSIMARTARKQTHVGLSEVVDEVRAGVEKYRPPAGLPRGPIHVDIKPDNELFIGDKLSAVIDFGNFYIDAYMIDVGKAIMWNCIQRKKLNTRLLSAFLEGYKSKRTLTRAEEEYLPASILFAIYSHIWVDLYHVPLGYVPAPYTLSLIRKFLPVARALDIQPKKLVTTIL